MNAAQEEISRLVNPNRTLEGFIKNKMCSDFLAFCDRLGALRKLLKQIGKYLRLVAKAVPKKQ